MDSSGFSACVRMSQCGGNALWHTYAYFAKKFNHAYCNHPTCDGELLSIIMSLEEWDAELRGVYIILM
jgi:hypothetical protein